MGRLPGLADLLLDQVGPSRQGPNGLCITALSFAGMNAIAIHRSACMPETVEKVLRDLPEWFGIEEAIADYVEQAHSLPNVRRPEWTRRRRNRVGQAPQHLLR